MHAVVTQTSNTSNSAGVQFPSSAYAASGNRAHNASCWCWHMLRLPESKGRVSAGPIRHCVDCQPGFEAAAEGPATRAQAIADGRVLPPTALCLLIGPVMAICLHTAHLATAGYGSSRKTAPTAFNRSARLARPCSDVLMHLQADASRIREAVA